MDEYYRILNLSEGATIADIKKAYRSLAMQYHPDVNPSQEASIRFQQVSDAYRTLLTFQQTTLAQAYAEAATQYQIRYQQLYSPPPPPNFEAASETYAPVSDVEETTLAYRVTYFMLDLISWGVSLFFIALPFFAGYLMAEKGFGWWEGAMMSPLSLAGMLVMWRTIRFRKNAF